jgi:hypothetical protein
MVIASSRSLQPSATSTREGWAPIPRLNPELLTQKDSGNQSGDRIRHCPASSAESHRLRIHLETIFLLRESYLRIAVFTRTFFAEIAFRSNTILRMGAFAERFSNRNGKGDFQDGGDFQQGCGTVQSGGSEHRCQGRSG